MTANKSLVLPFIPIPTSHRIFCQERLQLYVIVRYSRDGIACTHDRFQKDGMTPGCSVVLHCWWCLTRRTTGEEQRMKQRFICARIYTRPFIASVQACEFRNGVPRSYVNSYEPRCTTATTIVWTAVIRQGTQVQLGGVFCRLNRGFERKFVSVVGFQKHNIIGA